MISLRLATPDDAEKLLEIYRPYVLQTAITFEYKVPSVGEFRQRIENTLKFFPYLVAEDENGTLLGYAYASRFHPRAAYQWSAEASVYLRQNARGQGIGRMLYTKMEECLKVQGILNLNACIAVPRVETPYLTEASIHFHQKMGYSMVGRFHDSGYKFGHWFDMAWMEKMLGTHGNDLKAPAAFKDTGMTI